MKCKKIILAVSLAAVFGFIGCGDDSSSPSAAGGDDTVLSSDSNGDEDGKVASSGSKDEKATSAESKDEKSESSGEGAEKTSSDSKDEGSKDSSGDPKVADSSKTTAPGDSVPFDYTSMMACSEEGATQNQMGMTLTCKDGQWTADSSAFASMFSCSSERQVGFVSSKTNSQPPSSKSESS